MNKNKDASFYVEQIGNCIFPTNTQSSIMKLLLSRSLKSSLNNATQIYNLWGMMSLFSNQPSGAAKILQKATILNPNNLDAKINLAKALFELGKEIEGMKALKCALKISPSAHSLHRDLINALLRYNKLNKLQEIYSETAKELPPGVNIANLYLKAADVLIDKEIIPQASKCFEKIVQIFPENERFHIQYGNLLHQECRFEEAIREFREALELDPECLEARDLIAKVEKRILEDPSRFDACF